MPGSPLREPRQVGNGSSRHDAEMENGFIAQLRSEVCRKQIFILALSREQQHLPSTHRWACAAFVLLRVSRSKGEGGVCKMLAEYPRMNLHT